MNQRTQRGKATKPTNVGTQQTGAERNQRLARDGVPDSGDVLLPSLDDGLTMLDIEGKRAVPVVQSLVLDHLLTADGPAFWVDAMGHATTSVFARLVPSRRMLDRINVARAFTARQHFAAVQSLRSRINDHIQETTVVDTETARRNPQQVDAGEATHLPAILVAPAVGELYRSADSLTETEGTRLLARALARMSRYATAYDVPVLVMRGDDDAFGAVIDAAADHHIECEQTRMGPRFVAEDFETLVYPVEDGEYYQTTFAYWQHVLQARAAQHGIAPAPPSGPGEATGNTSGPGVEETSSMTTGPLRDAWTTAGGVAGW